MNAVTDMASTSVPSSNAARVSQVVPEQTSAATDQSSTAQPFTDVLSEQTSKASRDTSDKAESTDGLTSPSHGRPALSSKKSVAVDASTLVVPLVAPVLPVVAHNAAPVAVGVTAEVTDAAPVAIVATAHLIEVPPPITQATVAVAVDARKGDSTPPVSPREVDTFTHSDAGGFSGAVLAKGAVSGTPAARTVGVGENAGHVGAEDRPAVLTTGPTGLTRDQAMIPLSSWTLGSDDIVKVAKVAPEVHSSQSMPTGPDVGAKPEHLRDGSIRVTPRFAEPTSETASSPPFAHSQPLDLPVSPTSPVSALVSGADAFGADAPVRLAPLIPHSLDVGELAGAISRPLNEGIGGYTVQIAMRPADLGQLQAVVTLHGNDLQVSITPQTHVGHDALANAVDTLKEKLSDGGVNVNVTLHDPGSQSRGDDRPATTAVRGEAFSPEESATILPPSPVLAPGQIHLIL